MNDNYQHVKWFRDSSPYINAHRDKVFVIYIGGETIEHENFPNIIADIVLLNSLGVRLVLVHGATPQIDRYLQQQKIHSENVANIRVTTPEALPAVQYVVGKIKIDLEFISGMGENGLPFIIVFTKCDKIGKTKVQQAKTRYSKVLLSSWDELPLMITSSSTTGMGRDELLDYIETHLPK